MIRLSEAFYERRATSVRAQKTRYRRRAIDIDSQGPMLRNGCPRSEDVSLLEERGSVREIGNGEDQGEAIKRTLKN